MNSFTDLEVWKKSRILRNNIFTIDHLTIALDNNWINNDVFESFKYDCEECMKMINGYINFLRKQAGIDNPAK